MFMWFCSCSVAVFKGFHQGGTQGAGHEGGKGNVGKMCRGLGVPMGQVEGI